MDQLDKKQNTATPSQAKKIDGIFLYQKKTVAPIDQCNHELEKVRVDQARSSPSITIKHTLYIALLLLFIAITPIKMYAFSSEARTKSAAIKSAFRDIQSDIENKQFEEARIKLVKLDQSINSIKNDLSLIGQNNAIINKNSQFSDPLKDEELYLQAASNLTHLSITFFEEIKFFSEFHIANIFNTQEDNTSLLTNLNNLSANIKSNKSKIIATAEILSKLSQSTDAPEEIRNLTKSIAPLIKNIDAIDQLASSSTELLGASYDKKYLILFQNNTELRPTGGFIGSYGIITIGKGKIKSIFIDSIYNPDGQLIRKIEPPEPLQKITPYLAMRDANWDPDFPATARTISEIYESEGGFTPDGIVAVDTNLFIDLLKITGPIEVKEHDSIVTSENFINLVQYKTSIDYDQSANNPKKFLSDLAPLLLESLAKTEDTKQKELYSILSDSTKSRSIQFFHRNKETQKSLDQLGLTGSVIKTNNDYSMIVEANIGGMKTNNEIDTHVEHTVNIDNKKNIAAHSIKIRKRHNGSFNWPSGRYFGYLRIYTPANSNATSTDGLYRSKDIIRREEDGMLSLSDSPEFIDIEKLDISIEGDKKIYGGWVALNPGDEKTIELSYTTPISPGKYNLIVQKQAGSSNTKYQLNVAKKINNRIIPGQQIETYLNRDIIITID